MLSLPQVPDLLRAFRRLCGFHVPHFHFSQPPDVLFPNFEALHGHEVAHRDNYYISALICTCVVYSATGLLMTAIGQKASSAHCCNGAEITSAQAYAELGHSGVRPQPQKGWWKDALRKRPVLLMIMFLHCSTTALRQLRGFGLGVFHPTPPNVLRTSPHLPNTLETCQGGGGRHVVKR